MLVLYLHAAKREEISRIGALFYLGPVFTAGLAALVLGEFLSGTQYLGASMIVLAAILISTKSLSKMRPTLAFWLMVLASLAMAVSQVIAKYLIVYADAYTLFAYVRIGLFLFIIPPLIKYWPEINDVTRRHGSSSLLVLALPGALGTIALLMLVLAVTSGPVSAVSALTATGPFFVLTLAIVLGRWFPRAIPEEVRWASATKKLILIMVMFIGIILVAAS